MRLIDHTSITVRDLARVRNFYVAVMDVLGARVAYERADAIGFGERNRPHDDAHTYISVFQSPDASPDPRRHYCFRAESQEQVDRFHSAGLAARGSSEGALGCDSIILSTTPRSCSMPSVISSRLYFIMVGLVPNLAVTGRADLCFLIDSPREESMPITAFQSFNDGLDPSRRSRDHFIADTKLEDDRLWVPYATGVWFQPCCFNVTSGGFSVVLKGLPGSMVGTHYHVGTVHGYTMRGHWRYLEHDWIAKPGTYIYEPAGESHTLVITEDSPEPMMAVFIVEGGLIYLDKPTNGSFAAYEDGFTLLDLTRKYYREAGLDVRQLDSLVR